MSTKMTMKFFTIRMNQHGVIGEDLEVDEVLQGEPTIIEEVDQDIGRIVSIQETKQLLKIKDHLRMRKIIQGQQNPN